jgi:hypothetical protein
MYAKHVPSLVQMERRQYRLTQHSTTTQHNGARAADVSRLCADRTVTPLYGCAGIERLNLLPPLMVVQILSKNHAKPLSVVRDYVIRALQHENAIISSDQREIERYQQETAQYREDIQQLKTRANTFQGSKCHACTSSLALPAVHFLCMHSFHEQCVADSDRQCPICAPEFRKGMEAHTHARSLCHSHALCCAVLCCAVLCCAVLCCAVLCCAVLCCAVLCCAVLCCAVLCAVLYTVIEMKEAMRASASAHDKFFKQLEDSKDGFSTVAEYFGRGIFDKAAANKNAAAASTASMAAVGGDEGTAKRPAGGGAKGKAGGSRAREASMDDRDDGDGDGDD